MTVRPGWMLRTRWHDVRLRRRRNGYLWNRHGGRLLALASLTLGTAFGAVLPPAAGTVRQTQAATPEGLASTSTRGVTATRINVEFPVVNLQALSSQLGFAGDVEYTEQVKAIKLYVGEINRSGGIHGRRINPIISFFDPTNAVSMRALCKTWTEGTPPVFAVLDGVGAWAGVNQLCVTQEGHTPLLSQGTATTSWTSRGSPYLWWTGPDQSVVLQALVNWGLSDGLLAGKKVGVVVGDDAADQVALRQSLLPDLQRAGVTNPTVTTIAANPSDAAQTNSDAPLVVQHLRTAGVQSVIPLIPFNVFFPVLQAQTQQQYFPRLLLSDYQSSITSALGLLPIPYEKALDGQEGVTTYTLGGIDDPRPESAGGYDPGVRSCFATLASGLSRSPEGQPDRRPRGARAGTGVVPRDPGLRDGCHCGRSEPEPPFLHGGDGADPELPRWILAHLDVRAPQI